MSACPDLDELRLHLQEAGLSRADLAADPFAQFDALVRLVVDAGLHEPEAMVVSTAGRGDLPSSRYVLLRGVDHGFVFFTNYESRKGAELAPPRSVDLLPVARALPSGAGGGSGRAGDRRRERRLLRVPAPRQPGRCLGVARRAT